MSSRAVLAPVRDASDEDEDDSYAPNCRSAHRPGAASAGSAGAAASASGVRTAGERGDRVGWMRVAEQVVALEGENLDELEEPVAVGSQFAGFFGVAPPGLGQFCFELPDLVP